MKEKQLSDSNSIKNSYSLYINLLEEDKIISSQAINMSTKEPHPTYLTGNAELKHKTLNIPIMVIVEASKHNLQKFEFKIFANTLHHGPCFRFESDGHFHYNNLDYLTLIERQVSTPHFHRFLETGKEIAFKTDALKDSQKESILLNDRNFAFSHFCHEGNIKPDNNNYPEIIDGELLRPENVPYDPLEGVNF